MGFYRLRLSASQGTLVLIYLVKREVFGETDTHPRNLSDHVPQLSALALIIRAFLGGAMLGMRGGAIDPDISLASARRRM